MRRNLFLKKVSILLLVGIQLLCAVDLNDLNIAIIWNTNPTNWGTPYGWSVGDPVTKKAPEISQAQVKKLLSSFSNVAAPTSPVDTVGIPRSLRDGKGIPSGPYQGELKNVRIYCWDDAPLSLNMIKSDFGNKKPEAIVYINGGAQWGSDSNGSDGGLYQTLLDAANDDIGIMTIGDASAAEAKSIDTSRTIFPVMGVQKRIRFKAFGGDIIREFNFLKENDLTWTENADTVLLHSDISHDNEARSRYWMTLANKTGNLEAGTVIYECKGTSGTTLPEPTINLILPGIEIFHAYGEWSIKAKAVEVIDSDCYSPEMGAGIFNNHNVTLVSKRGSNSVYVSSAKWGSDLWVNGTILAQRGAELPNVTSYGAMDEENLNFVFSKDYIVESANIDDPSIVDSILIVRAGTTIPTGDITIAAHYLGSYNAGGYANLKIELTNTNSQIFGEVFPSLKESGTTTLNYLPWTKNGRIKANADIWDFNALLNIKPFDAIAANGFDPDVYYCSYFGDQQAGKTGYPHFVRAPKNRAEFDLSADKMSVDSIGYYDGSDWEKIYHAISVLQHGHRRLVMLGFQPTYIDNPALVSALLKDAVTWIGVDDYHLPTPTITPIYEGSDLSSDTIHTVYTDIDSFRVDVDFSSNGPMLSSAPFKLKVTVEYDKGVQDFDLVTFDAAGRKSIESKKFALTDLITINSANTGDTIISITAQAVPVTTPAGFNESAVSTTTYSLYKLEKPAFKNSDGIFTGTKQSDIVTTNKTTSSTGAVATSDVTMTCTFSGDTVGTVSGVSSLEYDLVKKNFSVSVIASKSKYLNSDIAVRTYQQVRENNSAYFDSDADGMIDSVRIELNRIESLPASITLINPESHSDVQKITDQAQMMIEGNAISIKMETPFVTAGTGFEEGDFLMLSGPGYDTDAGEPAILSVQDSVAPIMLSASYHQGTPNKVVIKFSEPVNPISSTEPFWFIKSNGDRDAVTMENTVSLSSNTYEFIVGAIPNGVISDYDSLYIKTGIEAANNSVAQNNLMNKRISLNEYDGTAITPINSVVQDAVSDLLIYPNPVNRSENGVNLTIPSNLSGEWELAIYDMLGNVLDKSTFTATGGTSYSWDLYTNYGVRATSGSYVLIGKYKDNDGVSHIFKKIFGIQE